jgi:NADPH-dependent glutamate synthase beta subunit-like oxidoreductase
MGKPTGFLEYKRELPSKRPVKERRKDYKEFVNLYEPEQLNKQAARCMNCGIPFCHHGCPLGNVIPEFNDAVYRKACRMHTISRLPRIIFLNLREEYACALRNQLFLSINRP